MTDRFMQQNARPASAEHHRQRTGRRGHRREVNQRHAYGLFRPCVSTDFAIEIGKEIVIAKTPAATAGAAFTLAILFNLYAYRQTHQRTDVSGQRTVGRRHQNQFINTGQTGGHFLNALVCGTRHVVYAAQNIQLLFTAHALQGIN